MDLSAVSMKHGYVGRNSLSTELAGYSIVQWIYADTFDWSS